MAILRPVIPAQIFKAGKSNPAARVGYGDKVAVIGAFPCVSSTVISTKSYNDAMELLNIQPNINDKYHTNNTARSEAQLNPTKDYFDGARCLKQLFREDSNDNLGRVSEAIVINISTDSGQCDSNNSEIKLLNGELTFGSTNVDSNSAAGTPGETPTSGGTSTNEGNTNTGNNSNEGNTNSGTDSNEGETSTTSENTPLTKLDYALERLKEEEYDILLLAFTPTKAQVEQLIKFTEEEYRRSNPIGIIYGYGDEPRPIIKPDEHKSVVETVVNTTKSLSISAAEQTAIKEQLQLFEDATVKKNHHHTLYGLIPLSFKLNYSDYWLSPIESAAYYCGVVAGRRVDQSMIDELMPNVEAVNEDLIYKKDSILGGATDGYSLVEKGATMFKKNNRASNEVVCINSTQPGKGDRIYDLSHLRTAAYVIRKMNLREFFGEHENRLTYDATLTKLTTIQSNLITEFRNILYDITYALNPHDNNCLDVYVEIECYDVLLQEEIYVNEEVLPWQL